MVKSKGEIESLLIATKNYDKTNYVKSKIDYVQ